MESRHLEANDWQIFSKHMPNLAVMTQVMLMQQPNLSCKNILMMVCWLQATNNGISAIITAHRCLTRETILTIDNISTKHSNKNNQYFWSQEESTTHTRWMRLRVRGCQTTHMCRKTVTFMENLAGFLTSMSNAPKITMRDTQETENILMVPWTTTWLSIILQWPTLNSSDKMLLVNQLQGRESKQCQCRTDPSSVPPWDQPRALSRHLSMPLHSCSRGTFLINTKLCQRSMELNSLLMLFHFWELHMSSGMPLPSLLVLRETTVHSSLLEIKHSQLASTTKTAVPSTMLLLKRRESSNCVEKTDGTSISSLFLSTTLKFTDPWRFHSRESDLNWKSFNRKDNEAWIKFYTFKIL